MKKTIKNLLFIAAACVFGLTACNTDDDENKQYFSGYFTITGTYPNYVLVEDGGAIVYPTAQSINNITNNKGFGQNKRALFEGSYKDENAGTENGVRVIRQAEILGGNYIYTSKSVSKEEAEKANIFQSDSIFSIASVNNCWVANGYFTTIFNARMAFGTNSIIQPTLNLYADPASIGKDSITFTLLYNCHSDKKALTSSESTLMVSFDITSLQIPGNNDSITAKVKAEGLKDGEFKIARKNLNRTSY